MPGIVLHFHMGIQTRHFPCVHLQAGENWRSWLVKSLLGAGRVLHVVLESTEGDVCARGLCVPLATSLTTRAWPHRSSPWGSLCTFRTKVQNTGSSCCKVSQGPASSARPPQPAPRRGTVWFPCCPHPLSPLPNAICTTGSSLTEAPPRPWRSRSWVIPKVRLTPGGGLG